MSPLLSSRRSRLLGACGLAGLAGGVGLATLPAAQAAPVPAPVQHVLVLSIDGMHQSDLTYYVAHHPGSALAALVAGGKEFTGAQTPFPSDSLPGMVGPFTGGNPAVTGVYYDDTYNRALLPPGTTSCAGLKPGTEVALQEAVDNNQHALDAGQGLPGLPDSILAMTANPFDVIDPAKLPVDPATCQPVYPHSYVKVNTVFEVARAAGLRTAWSDKHPAYEILNGPSNTGVQDYFTPEINSDAPTTGSPIDWTKTNALTMQYDSYKVQAVLNWIIGKNHSGTASVGVPAIYGMNFQTVSTAQKLPVSGGLAGGYLADGVTPGPLLSKAFDFINAKVGAMMNRIKVNGYAATTTIILSAKHGQSPTLPSALTRIPDGPILAAMNAQWLSTFPSAPQPLVALSVDDDGMLLWLNDRVAGPAFAKTFLLNHSGVGNDITGSPKPYTSSGLTKVYAGAEAANVIGVRQTDSRVPDVIGLAKYGTVFTGGKGKIAEHGGANPQDRNVPLVVSGAGVVPGVVGGPARTIQIAPTILTLLGLDPLALQAVQSEGTPALPLG